MTDVVIVQRTIPHYRASLFKKLYDEYGWLTVAAANFPGDSYLNIDESAQAHIRRYTYVFPNRKNLYACSMPMEEIIKDLKPRSVIAEFSLRNNASRTLRKLRRKKLIDSYALWSHGWNMDRGFFRPTDLASQAQRLMHFSRADLLITYSDEGRRWVQKFLPMKKVLSVGNTLDTTALSKELESEAAVRHGCPQLLFVGRLTEDKRVDVLLEVFRAVLKELPGAALTVIGDGPELTKLREISEDLSERVRFMGSVYDERLLARCFRGADLFVITGAAGLSVNHALAYNLPVAAYGRGRGLPRHHPEIAYVVNGVTGLLCKEPSPSAMASAIVAAYAQGQIENLRKQIPNFVRQDMSIEGMVKKFALVKSLL